VAKKYNMLMQDSHDKRLFLCNNVDPRIAKLVKMWMLCGPNPNNNANLSPVVGSAILQSPLYGSPTNHAASTSLVLFVFRDAHTFQIPQKMLLKLSSKW